MAEKVWFITGSSRGFGRALVRAALEAGDPDAVAAAMSAARQRFGRIDVIVNNAGYANVSPIETGDDDDLRAQFEPSSSHRWAAEWAVHPVLPLTRRRSSPSTDSPAYFWPKPRRSA